MPRTTETSSFKFNHTALRIKDPKASLHFYTKIIGMDLLAQTENTGYTQYFVAYDCGDNLSDEEKKDILSTREGVLELLHFHGTESNPSFSGYASGNSEPGLGFGHIAITVDDVHKVCKRFEALGITFTQRPGGEFGDVAAILDPDGYYIEVSPQMLRSKL